MNDPPDNVVDLKLRRERKQLQNPNWGVFCDPSTVTLEQFLDDVLQPLKQSGAPCAIGLMTPVGGPVELPGESYCGWMLTPEQARALSAALARYADNCEQGYE